MGSLSNQLPYHKLIEVPFPAVHFLSFWIRTERGLIFFQIQDPAIGFLEFQMERFRKYLARNHLPQRESEVDAQQPSW